VAVPANRPGGVTEPGATAGAGTTSSRQVPA
jgi:hypothetical protein